MREFNKEGSFYGVLKNPVDEGEKFWVDSELGDDINGDGSYEKPFKSPDKAEQIILEKLKKINKEVFIK